jgi:hypothetical protein
MAKAIYRHPLNRRILVLSVAYQRVMTLKPWELELSEKYKVPILESAKMTRHSTEDGSILLSLMELTLADLLSVNMHFGAVRMSRTFQLGKIVKQTVVADEGFYLAECDLEQAETRDTAYITGDKNLIAVINGPRDFHSHNVEAFFGLPYDTIYDAKTKKVLNKPIRNTGKRVNHGANYNMGPDVLVDTMGEEAVYEAARLLKLPRQWTAREIAEHFLKGFDKTYPTIRGEYHVWVINQILTTRLLKGATGWTRYCFDNPKKSKASTQCIRSA